MVHNPSAVIIAALCALFLPARSEAVSFDLVSAVGGVWTYDLTYDPLDNYSIFQPSTTITLSGLSGVTGATAPTSTDFDPPGGFLDVTNLAWTPQVLGGGTEVVWTHIGSGTGNFGEPKHVFGFQVFAPGAVTGDVSLVTDGFSTDTTEGGFDRDINTSTLGPVTAVPEPTTLLLLGTGLAVELRRRQMCHPRRG